MKKHKKKYLLNVKYANKVGNLNVKKEDQVCSLELAKRLDELGVKQDSLYVWITVIKTGFNFIKYKEEWEPNSKEVGAFNYPAFTVSELGELLPNRITISEDNIPFESFTIVIKKFYTVSEDRATTNNYILNYECDSTEIAGENAWLRRYLMSNIFDPNLANAMARMLIHLIENGFMKNE